MGLAPGGVLIAVVLLAEPRLEPELGESALEGSNKQRFRVQPGELASYFAGAVTRIMPEIAAWLPAIRAGIVQWPTALAGRRRSNRERCDAQHMGIRLIPHLCLNNTQT